jgi:ribosomal protein S27AE
MVTLPDIPIPYARHREPCRRGSGGNMTLCLLCERPLDRTKSHVVVLDQGCGRITDPNIDQERSGGCFDIGPDCWRNNPQLHPYEVRGATAMTLYRPDCPVCSRSMAAVELGERSVTHAKRTCPVCRRRFLLTIRSFPDRACEMTYDRIPGLDPRRHED